MAVRVVVGAQFGDEGKGKMVDWLARDADLVVRYQGGDNAGHTVINEHGVFKLHIVPCGIFRPRCRCLIGTGTVVNPDVLIAEMEMLHKAGIGLGNLRLSGKAQLILPWHVALDGAMERCGGIGTTKRGVGQAYADKFLRKNLRAEDLLDTSGLKEKLAQHLDCVNAQLAFWGAPAFGMGEMLDKCLYWREKLSPLLCDAVDMVHAALEREERILFEGQLGAMKDIDLGIYPFVTSSHPVAAYAAVSGGFSPKRIDCITGYARRFPAPWATAPSPRN